MKKYGITGNIASGKSVAFEVIKNYYPIIDCDDIVKNLYKNNIIIKKIYSFFPQIAEKNEINYKKLSDLLFNNIKFKKEYENFIFPLVKNQIENFLIENKNQEKVFVIAPLLFEANFETMFDKIIFISSAKTIREKRLKERKTFLSCYAKEVINSQIDEEEKIKKSDIIIENNGTLSKFQNAIIEMLNNLDSKTSLE